VARARDHECFYCVPEDHSEKWGVKIRVSPRSWIDGARLLVDFAQKLVCNFGLMSSLKCSKCVFITAVPITKLFAWREGDRGGHVGNCAALYIELYI
jgi:hypothetical protein